MANVNRSTTIDLTSSQLNMDESFNDSRSESESECDHKLLGYFCKTETQNIKLFLQQNPDLNIFDFKKKDNNRKSRGDDIDPFLILIF